MTFYEKRLPQLHKQVQDLTDNFFTATKLLEMIK
jgi:hypothetical protein